MLKNTEILLEETTAMAWKTKETKSNSRRHGNSTSG